MENKQTNKIIFFTAQTQYENLGDLMITKILLNNLRKYGTLIINERDVPEFFSQGLEIKDDEKASKYGIKFIIVATVVAFKALFDPNSQIYYIRNPGHIFSSPKNNIDYLIHLINRIKTIITWAFLKIIGVRICQFGASVGPLSKMDQLAEKWLAKIMYFYSVRDTKSEDYANKIGINKVEIFPDLAWLLKTPYVNNKLVKSEDEYVIFSFRESTNPLDDPGAYKVSLFPVLDEIVKLVCGNWHKKLLISYQVDFDYDFCKDISNRYKDDHDVIFIEKKVDAEYMYDLYSRAYMVFSNRLHVLMFAMLSGSIPIGVVDGLKHDKITGIFSDAGLTRLVIDIRSNVDYVPKILNEINSVSDVVKRDIDLCIEDKQKSGDVIFRHVMT